MIPQLPQDTVASPDTFLRLTGTAWTALGSIISALSVIALVVFNFIYLRRVHAQTDASIEQARTARATLESLQLQIAQQQKTEYFHAYSILARCAMELIQIHDRLMTEHRSGDEQIELIPNDWNFAVTYVSREFPLLHGEILNAGSNLNRLERDVNRCVRVPFGQRGPNTSIMQIIGNTRVGLHKLSHQINTIMSAISKERV